MKCSKCNCEINDNVIFCPSCGSPVKSQTLKNTQGKFSIKTQTWNANAQNGNSIKVQSLNTTVQIKLSPFPNVKKIASIYAGDKKLWSGYVGETIELEFDKPTYVTIKYHIDLIYLGAKCQGLIDPSKHSQYNVFVNSVFPFAKISLEPVNGFGK